MTFQSGRCPMTGRQLLDEYFIESRTKLLDLAAFLDRLDRTIDQTHRCDFRMRAFREALQLLCIETPSRVNKMLMLFSDPTTEPLRVADQKSARGAYDRSNEEAQ